MSEIILQLLVLLSGFGLMALTAGGATDNTLKARPCIIVYDILKRQYHCHLFFLVSFQITCIPGDL